MVLSMDRWVGKVAVVTGASSGIGKAIVDQLVEKGLIVVGIARRVVLLQKHTYELAGKKGKFHAVQADITKEEEVVKAFKWIADNLGPVHILINNAGVTQPTTTLYDGKTEMWESILNLNVLGLSIATREAIKSMKAANINGHIVHINSVLGHKVVDVPNLNVYPASKFAVTALTETLRQELNSIGSKIKISSVSPGLVATEMTIYNKNLPAQTKELFQKMPILKPEDIADGVVHVLSTPPHVQIHELTIQPVGQM